MPAIATNDKQRLAKLERHIVKLADRIHKNGLEIGRGLIEIRDYHLWKSDYESWNQYLRVMAVELVNRSWSQATKLIQSAEVESKVASINVDTEDLDSSHFREIGRLAPVAETTTGGTARDYSKLKKKDVETVLKAASDLSGDGDISVLDLKKAVDTQLGVNRDARKTPKEPGIDLHQFLLHATETVEVTIKHVDGLSIDIWTLLDEQHPKLRERVAKSCDRLAEFLRS